MYVCNECCSYMVADSRFIPLSRHLIAHARHYMDGLQQQQKEQQQQKKKHACRIIL